MCLEGITPILWYYNNEAGKWIHSVVHYRRWQTALEIPPESSQPWSPHSGGFLRRLQECLFAMLSCITHVLKQKQWNDYPQYLFSSVLLNNHYFWRAGTNIDHLILPPSKPIWSHSHILSKNFDPGEIIWIFPRWVVKGLTLISSCLPSQYCG